MNNGTTRYHENFKKWLIRFQTEELVGCCAQTDVKGDRILRPADQLNPDAYVWIKERLVLKTHWMTSSLLNFS